MTQDSVHDSLIDRMARVEEKIGGLRGDVTEMRAQFADMSDTVVRAIGGAKVLMGLGILGAGASIIVGVALGFARLVADVTAYAGVNHPK